MKKRVLCALFYIFSCSQAFALSDLEISGELDASVGVSTLPTGERGNSNFAVPGLFLDINAPLKEENVLTLVFEGSESKTSSTERFDVKVREAYVDLVSLFAGMHAVRFGLIPQVWQEAQYETYHYRFLERDAWAMTEKWRYLNPSDLGISFMSELSQNFGEWALTFSNGEGAEGAEEGSHKEASLFLRLTPVEPWSFSFGYTRGTYELYGEGVSLKERIQALMMYEGHGAVTWGLELLATQDPADGMTALDIADDVDVSALSGQAVKGQAASLFTVISTGPKAELMLRYDYLNAVVGEDGKNLQTGLASLAYQLTDDVKAALVVDYTKYGESFSVSARDRTKISIAGQALF
ncbi:hypothetical protein [Bdellovibrio reynosensis]|uniref:Porin n=1 Tax=Bdellovibrio reynosensis TaxID=2835041 RepID=A0ABY4CDF6_9BACT|nr:hypothetical protein [Bdellovibrio reynosensis]UOF02824.1 hypothetical protein MNR06_07645 [Bdellovibrio reynosensis]